jgi:hypothetical protein
MSRVSECVYDKKNKNKNKKYIYFKLEHEKRKVQKYVFYVVIKSHRSSHLY